MITEGSVLGQRYVIEACIGRGGMGAVYRAHHTEVGRPFAVKVLHASLCADAVVVARFRREAELAGRLRHDNVVAVVDMGQTDDGEHYLVMEYAPGAPLDKLVAGGPMTEARVIELGKQLCDGLQHAHDAGVIHRDFKPDNVIVEQLSGGREVARIVDFGVAILRDDARDIEGGRLTTKGIVVGTPHYMAPEQARGIAVDHRIDLFALGLILYELLAGKPPFEGTGVDVARAHLRRATPPMGIRAPGIRVEPVLEALVRTLLAKNPDDRLPSARSVSELLDLYGRDRDSAAALLGVRERLNESSGLPPLQQVIAAGRSRSANQSAAPYEHLLDGPRPAREAVPERAPEPAPEPPPRRARAPLVVGAVAGAAVLAVGLYLATKEPPQRRAPIAAETPRTPTRIAHARPDPAAAPEAAEAPVAPVRRAAPLPSRAIEAPAPATPATAFPAKRPSAPRAPASAPAPIQIAAATTNQQLVDLYQRVGRALRTYAEVQPDGAQELWARYRWIRIQDAMSTADKRVETMQILERLQRRISDSRRE